MEIKHTNDPKEFEDYANECLSGHEGAVIHLTESPCVWVGLLDDVYDQEECKKHNLSVHQGHYYAGAIVNMPDDVSICITTWGNTTIGYDICQAVKNLLIGKNIEVAEDVNDILADGKKVASYCSVMQVSGWCQTVVHISVGKMDIDLVKAICKKPMIKIPGSLSEYGITSDDIIPVVQNILRGLK